MFGAAISGSERILDFWPVGAGGTLGNAVRGLFDLSRVLLVLPLAGFLVGLLVAAGIALWHRHLRRMTSSLVAIMTVPIGVVIVAWVPLFNPWVWYALANRTRFEALAASVSPSAGPQYAVIEVRDVSTGLAGLSPLHFVALIYDQSDAVGLEPSERPAIWRTRHVLPGLDSAQIPQGRWLFGHFFTVDVWE